MAKKDRADILIFQQGLAESREQAKRLIMAGRAFAVRGAVYDEEAPAHLEPPREMLVPVPKPGQPYPLDTLFHVTGPERFVSRGAYKLLTAIEHFKLNMEGLVALDAGASTGGFTDCLLQHGAARVYAVDVGKHQLHERLRGDARVISLEGVNLRHAEPSLIPEQVGIIVADVSFISLTLVLEPCMGWLAPGGLVAALIKPQFEVGPGGTDKGVVRNDKLREEAVRGVLLFARERLGLTELGVVPSAIKGPKGNQEYMALWRNGQS